MGRHRYRLEVPVTAGDVDLHLIHNCLGPLQSISQFPNGSSVALASLARSTVVINASSYRPRYVAVSVAIARM